MADRKQPPLSRRERQIMDIAYRLGSATAADVLEALPDPPSYSAVRAMLRILEEKGHLTHRHDGPRYVYSPVVPRTAARQSALRSLVRTFFDGSATQAAAALLDMSDSRLTPDEAEQLTRLIEKAKREGK
ncbi:MAG TPA: BlaI/MecI/CopY family transcriptional regulator [Gemmatimonadaceae bacterium]|jgi:predicted transcriptional regulator|nr:BlaI/MecI/CopY family transcriptional regulator [Gemmatimonadaceae bacterium]